MEAQVFSYHKFAHFALEEAQRHMNLSSVPSLSKFRCMKAKDENTMLHMLSYQAPKIRLLRGLTVDGRNAMQVLDFGVFPKPEYNFPIFCGNFFMTPQMSIVVLDLNPLHDVINQKEYRDKYYNHLLPLGQKYAKILPWGDKITAESMRFFSPIVIWTKFTPNRDMQEVLYSAFMDYFKAWLKLVDGAMKEVDEARIKENIQAQHRYLTWRAEKDPGRALLQKLVGENLAEDIVQNFLFDGVSYLRKEAFLDYFPEYRCADGSISPKRSIIGKSFEERPWNERGDFIGGLTGL